MSLVIPMPRKFCWAYQVEHTFAQIVINHVLQSGWQCGYMMPKELKLDEIIRQTFKQWNDAHSENSLSVHCLSSSLCSGTWRAETWSSRRVHVTRHMGTVAKKFVAAAAAWEQGWFFFSKQIRNYFISHCLTKDGCNMVSIRGKLYAHKL